MTALQGQIALVTGGGSGIGRGIAIRFARTGAQVAVADINTGAAQSVAAEIRNSGGSAFPLQVDVGDEESVTGLIRTVEAETGGLHIIINNAGIDLPKTLDQMDSSLYDRVMAVDLRSIFLTAKYGAPVMERSGGGAIVNISSVMAWYTHPGYVAYTAAKAGVIGMTRTLAVELGPNGIRVNAICPGFIDTPIWQRGLNAMEPADAAAYADRIRSIHPVGRRGVPEDIAAAALFLCSKDAAFISGTHLVVDGAVTVKLLNS